MVVVLLCMAGDHTNSLTAYL